jgi:CRP-like cAMP-binding protein
MRKVLFMLGQLEDADAEWLAKIGRRETVRAGTVLIEEGRHTDSMFVVLDGVLGARRRRTGDEVVARLEAGEIVGEMSFVDARPPAATVAALADSTVLRIPRAPLEARLTEDGAFGARFYRSLATFLSDRLRTAVAAAEGGAEAEELDPSVLETLTRAGERFDRLLKRLAGR